jgi:alkanesulfonate monooxygenase SsuD/methylene tetrahydromethanopterin reductase-like flavin-dependent oxidoreductase (luciferase family)
MPIELRAWLNPQSYSSPFPGGQPPQTPSTYGDRSYSTAGRSPTFWINLNMLVGETDDAARQHLRELEQAIRRLREFRRADAELRAETLRLIKHAVTIRDAARKKAA